MGRLFLGEVATALDEADVTFEYLEEVAVGEDVDLDILIGKLVERLEVEDKVALDIVVPEELIGSEDDVRFVLVVDRTDTVDPPAEQVLAAAAHKLLDAVNVAAAAITRPELHTTDTPALPLDEHVATGSIRREDEPGTGDDQPLADLVQLVATALDPAADDANLVAVTSEHEDAAQQDSLSTVGLDIRLEETVDPFDPTVSITEGDEETILIRAGADMVNALVERLTVTGAIVSTETLTVDEPDGDPPLVLGLDIQLTPVTEVVTRAAVVGASEDIDNVADVAVESAVWQVEDLTTLVDALLNISGTLTYLDAVDPSTIVDSTISSRQSDASPTPVASSLLRGTVDRLDETTVLDALLDIVGLLSYEEATNVASASLVDGLIVGNLDTPPAADDEPPVTGDVFLADTPASAEQQASVKDYYTGTALTFTGEGATTPQGNIVRTPIDQDRGLGTVMVGEWDTSGFPDETLAAILYSFQVPVSLANDVVTLKWELPAPNFVDNWHFATDPIGNEWTHVNGGTDVQFSHNIQRGFRSAGCVEVSSGGVSTDRDQLHQRVTGLATGTGRTVTVKLHQIPADSGLASHEVHLRVYADDNGSKGAELANVLLASDDANWTEYTLVGDASGTQDFTIADDETALWVEIDANDQSSTGSLSRFFDDVRCEVSGLGEVTVAEQSPITPSKCSQLVVETFETYASGQSISNDGWDVQSSGNGISNVSTNNPHEGSQHLQNRIDSGSGTDNQDAIKLLDQPLSDVLVEVPFATPNFAVSTSQHVRLIDDAGNVFGEVIVTDADTVSAEIEGVEVISGLSVGSGYGKVRFTLVDENALGIELDLSSGDQDAASAALGTARTLSDIEVSAERSTGTQNSRIDVDQILVKEPVAVDVSSHNIPRSDVHDLLAWVEHNDGGDGGVHSGVESIGLRYTA